MVDCNDKWHCLSPSSDLFALAPVPPDTLKRFVPFTEFDAAQLREIAPEVKLARWQDGAILFREGEAIDLAFIVVRGSLNLYVRSNPKSQGEALELRVGKGDLVGEIGSTLGRPQPFTAITAGGCELLQIRVAGMQRLRAKIPSFGEMISKEYGRQTVLWALREHELFRGVNDMTLADLAGKASFKSYPPGAIIARQDAPADALYLIRGGFCRVSRVLVEEAVTINSLGPEEIFGAKEFLQPYAATFAHTISALQNCDVIEIPSEALRGTEWHYFSVTTRLHDYARAFNEKCDLREPAPAAVSPTLFQISNASKSDAVFNHERAARMEKIITQGLSDAGGAMLIDLQRCTQCNDCVRACADTHEGLPRFVREGERINDWLVANSCRHCREPLCLIGCPTNAIARHGFNAEVEIDESLCIGCSTCANNCPHGSIIMYDTGEICFGGDENLPQVISKARLVASKCDACARKDHGPACVKACPVGCLVLVENVNGLLSHKIV